MSEYKKSVEQYTKCLQIAPDFEDVQKQRAFVYLSLGDRKAAIADLTAALAHDPKRLNFVGFRADIYEKDGQLEKALADRTRIIQLVPNELNKYIDRAGLERKMGRNTQAVADLSKAISMGKTDDAYIRRGDLYCATGEFAKAVDDYTHALAAEPMEPGIVYSARAHAYEKLGKRDLAEKDLAASRQHGFK